MTLQKLWAPWRVGYIVQARGRKTQACLFCRLRRQKPDSKNLVLTRGKLGFSLLNRFPYNNGHLMVAPYRHVGRVELLTAEEWVDLLEMTRDAIQRITRLLHPHGYNLGINQGRVAGAGILGHIHLHLVPRWEGDTNFMPVVNGTKVISQSLAACHRLLQKSPPNRAKASRS